ncbi:hypothetical protein ABZZ20_30530 [Streptomyces sp. NPDC006430]
MSTTEGRHARLLTCDFKVAEAQYQRKQDEQVVQGIARASGVSDD